RAGTDGTWTFDYSDTTLADGTYDFTATATDSSGNRSATSAVLHVVIDGSTSAAPQVTGISPDTGIPGDGVTSVRNIVISGRAEAGATVQVIRDGVSLGTTLANNNGQWAFDNRDVTLSDNSYQFSAVATDLAGNQSATSLSFVAVIDGTQPP